MKRYGLVGFPLDFSLSPVMHQAAFAAAGLNATYELLPTREGAFDTVLAALRSGELAGVNVTVPHKVAARNLVEDESGLVARVGAINTIVCSPDGFWRGENTDSVGALRVLRRMGMDDGRGRRAVLLGAGGAARAVGAVLLQGRWSVDVVNRSAARAAVMVSHLYRNFTGARIGAHRFSAEAVTRLARGADLVVNATPLGAAPRVTAAPWPLTEPWPADVALFDLVAWPPESRLVAHARAAGAVTEGGLPMLVEQAAAAFRLWTALPEPREVMQAAATAEIARRQSLTDQAAIADVAAESDTR